MPPSFIEHHHVAVLFNIEIVWLCLEPEFGSSWRVDSVYVYTPRSSALHVSDCRQPERGHCSKRVSTA